MVPQIVPQGARIKIKEEGQSSGKWEGLANVSILIFIFTYHLYLFSNRQRVDFAVRTACVCTFFLSRFFLPHVTFRQIIVGLIYFSGRVNRKHRTVVAFT